MRRSRFFRARKDATQTAIVEALRAKGCEVFSIGYPCDLLVLIPAFPPGSEPIVRLLECKPLKRRRKDQPEQDDFLARTGTPRVRTPEEALRAVGL